MLKNKPTYLHNYVKILSEKCNQSTIELRVWFGHTIKSYHCYDVMYSFVQCVY